MCSHGAAVTHQKFRRCSIYPRGENKNKAAQETRPHVLFRVNQKATPVDSACIFCSTNGNGFSINAKFMFSSLPDPFQNDGLSTLEQELKEMRETP